MLNMVLKQRGVPLKLYGLEALYRRLPAHHHAKDRITFDLLKERRGLKGEKEVDYALRFLNNPFILHNLRLRDEFGAFQLDTLIITRKFLLILEVKNWYGTVIFGENEQVTRVGNDGVEEGFPNPVTQAQLQQYRVAHWLQVHKFPASIPIYFLVVISFPSTIIKSYSPEVPIPGSVIHTNQILYRFQELEKVSRQALFSKNQIMSLSNQLIKGHTPPKLNLLEQYNVNRTDLMTGVICPCCSHLPMHRMSGNWYCKTCKNKIPKAHLAAFNDYLLLINRYVTNSEMREFLNLSSDNSMKYLFQKSKFKSFGNTRDRYYELELTQQPFSKLPNLVRFPLNQ